MNQKNNILSYLKSKFNRNKYFLFIHIKLYQSIARFLYFLVKLIILRVFNSILKSFIKSFMLSNYGV